MHLHLFLFNSSAIRDSRFQPITKSEFSRLQCSISLLVEFETITDPYDWTIGVHGLQIVFVINNNKYSSTFLPEVCPSQGWSKKECLSALIRKSGFRGLVDACDEEKIISNMLCKRYQSSKCSMTYNEFLKFSN